jgi:hypothetical protein
VVKTGLLLIFAISPMIRYIWIIALWASSGVTPAGSTFDFSGDGAVFEKMYFSSDSITDNKGSFFEFC